MNSILKDLASCYVERLDCVTHFLDLGILRIIVLIALSNLEVLTIRTNDNYLYKGQNALTLIELLFLDFLVLLINHAVRQFLFNSSSL